MAVLALVGCGDSRSNAQHARDALAKLPSPLSYSFDAVFRADSTDGVSETWSVAFTNAGEWQMTVVDASEPPKTPGASTAGADPIGFRKVVHAGRIQLVEPGVVDLTQLGFTPDELVALQEKLGSKSQAVVEALVQSGVLQRADRVALDQAVDPAHPALPDLLFDLQAIQSKGVVTLGSDFAVDLRGTDFPYDSVTYATDGTPKAASATREDGSGHVTISVLSFKRR